MPEVSATEAARHFADLLDGVEHRGEHYTIIRRGKVVAHLEPVRSGRGLDVKSMLRRYEIDEEWSDELAEIRSLLVMEERG